MIIQEHLRKVIRFRVNVHICPFTHYKADILKPQ